MLDDLRALSKIDSQDMIGASAHQLAQLSQQWEISFDVEYSHVVLAGMGGSAVGGEMARVWPGVSKPFEISRGYSLPASVSKNTLVIITSYSGTTEESLSALEEAEVVGCGIAVITSGGKLSERAAEKGYQIAELGGANVRTPRLASLQGYAALVAILNALGACKEDTSQLSLVANNLQQDVATWSADTGTSKNYAKQLALELMGRSIVVYGGDVLEPVARRWKIGFNENAKTLAWTNALPELNHNEFTGWTGLPEDKPYATINLRSSLDHPRVQDRFEVTDKLLSGRRAYPQDVEAKGGSVLDQMIWTAVLGDFVSVYLAALHNVDPATLPAVDKLKKELS